jgi:hypothetical protein
LGPKIKRYLTQKLNPNLLKNKKKKFCKFFTTPEPNGSPKIKRYLTQRDYMNMF